MKKLPLHIKILIGLVLGIGWAFLSSALGWNAFTRDYIDPFGTIFIRMLKFIAVPLVLFSIISGISGLQDISKLGRLGAKTLGLYLFTTVVAVTIGLLLANLIAPGKWIDQESRINNRISYELWVEKTEYANKLDDRAYLKRPEYAQRVEEIRQRQGSAAPDESFAENLQSVEATKQSPPLQFLIDMVPENLVLATSNNALMLQVIFFAIFFGIALALLPPDTGKPVILFFNSITEVFLKMVDIIMKGAPFFVFALMAGVISKMANTPAEVFEIFKGLGVYSLTVVLGLAIIVFGVYAVLIHFVVPGIKYKEYLRKISPAQLLAFSTSSSAATLPVTIECVEDRIGVSKKISSFVLPVGATVNMDGTSLYQAVAVLFLAQMHMVDLTLGQQITIVLTATLASIGSAAVPSAGLVMLIIVLQSVQLNPMWIAIIFPVDRILDMCRTVVNVTGDTAVATMVAYTEGELNTDQPKTQEA